MKRILTLLFALAFVATAWADGWRKGEMEVKIELTEKSQFELLHKLQINGDFYKDHAVVYVLPEELQQLEAAGIDYEIRKADLNQYYQGFWDSEEEYYSYADIIYVADSLAENFPTICKKYTFGTSMGGRQLVALKISDNVEEDEAEPEVMFDGGIHGDELMGPELCIRFSRDIILDYGTDENITELINNREIWMYLMVNPDGRVNMSRYNNNGVDLNRDWGYMWDAWGGSSGAYSQVESKALRECMYNNQFVVHTTFHGGTEYISYPWSYRSDICPDKDHIDHLAWVYSDVSLYSNLEYGQGNTGMYAINGSTKDSNYGIMGSVSWSMEISYDKQPPPSQIMMYYNRNYPSMLAMVEYAGYGLEGTVTDINTGDPIQAAIFIEDFIPTFSDSEQGDYHKYVLPGAYDITVKANGYQTMTISDVTVTEFSSTVTDFELEPNDGDYVLKFSSSQIPDNNPADEGNTPAVIGAPDDINYSSGKNGWCVLDMGQVLIDGPGNDIKVHEGDSSPEGYTCYASMSMDGPWAMLGAGEGTMEFDLVSGDVFEAQFIKIMDDGDGPANTNDAGFDLDAIELLEHESGVYLSLVGYSVDDASGNNNGQIDPGETVDIAVTIRNNGDVLSENTTGEFTVDNQYISVEEGTGDFGTLGQYEEGEATFTLTADETTPVGESFVADLDVEANGGTYTEAFELGFTVGLVVEDWETGTFNNLPWTMDGNADWTITSGNPYEGNYCAKSGSIGDQQTTSVNINLDVTANGEITFYRKVSSESGYDYLRFYIDGNMEDQWSGEVSWGEVSYAVTTGNHTFTWEYYKDYSVSNGSDCGWIDLIQFPPVSLPVPPEAGFEADNTFIFEGQSVQFSDISSGNPTSWEWTFEGGTPATSSSPNPEVTYENAGSYDVSLTVTNNNGMDTKTVEDYISVNVLEPVYFDFEGGNPADPVYTIYLSGGVLQDEDLQPGDEIAIFDGETMVGAMMLDAVLTPENQFDNALIAFSTVTSGNGYTPGNTMTLKCYDASEEIESTGFEIEFYDPYGDAWTESYFPEDDGAYSIAGLTFTAGATQQMSLGAGYQFVSSCIIPPDPDMMTLCEDLMYDETLDFIRNSEGSMLQKIGPNWVNNIGDWNTMEAYLFKMNADDMLEMGGSVMDPQTPMTLEAGYQFISYLPETPIDALVAMETVLENLDFVRNSTGNMLQKIGPNWVNNIGNMNPGEGYLVRMNADDELIYPEATKSYQYLP